MVGSGKSVLGSERWLEKLDILDILHVEYRLGRVKDSFVAAVFAALPL